MREHLLRDELISADDLDLYQITGDVDEAVRIITRFYRNYHSQRFVKGRLVLRLQHAPTDDQMVRINDEFGDLVADGRFERIEATPEEIADGDVPSLARIRFHSTRRNLGRQRALIDALNDMAPEARPT